MDRQIFELLNLTRFRNYLIIVYIAHLFLKEGRMRKIYVEIQGENGGRMILKKVFLKRKKKWVFTANSHIFRCPFCGGTNLIHSPVICEDCDKEIGSIVGKQFRVSGNPFKNWRFLPNSKELEKIKEVRTVRYRGP